MCILFANTVDVLFFAGTYFRGQLSPNQFTSIKIRATRRSPQYSFHCVFQFAGINIRCDHVTANINTQRNILLLQYHVYMDTGTFRDMNY